MKKIATSVLIALLALTLGVPSSMAMDRPGDDKREPGRDNFGFGRLAVFDSIKKDNESVSTMKVTYLPQSSTTDVVLVNGLTEFKNIIMGSKPSDLDPASLKKGEYIFVNSMFGAPPQEGKQGKEFARMIVKSDLKGTIVGVRGRELMGTVEKLDGKTISVMPYGPHPKDKKQEAISLTLHDSMIVFKSDDKLENISQLKISDIKTGSKLVAWIMPLVKEGSNDEDKKEFQLFAVMANVLAQFPEMRYEQMAGIYVSSENNTMTVNPIRIDNRKDPGPGEGGRNIRPLGYGKNLITANEDPQPPEGRREPRTIEVKFDNSTTFVLNTGSKIEKINPSDIREKDKLLMTVQMRETNDEWFLYAKTVRVMQDFPNPATSREQRVFGTLENFGDYSITFKLHKADVSVTLAMDPDCVFIKQGEEGKRPEIIQQSDLKPGNKLQVGAIIERQGRPGNEGPGGRPMPNEDKQPKIEGTVFMVMVVDAFPNPMAVGQITEISSSKLVIEVPNMPGREKDEEKEKKTIEFIVNADTKFFVMSREGRKESKIADFKNEQWVMVEFSESDGTNTAISVTKTERPQNPNPPKDNPKPRP